MYLIVHVCVLDVGVLSTYMYMYVHVRLHIIVLSVVIRFQVLHCKNQLC